LRPVDEQQLLQMGDDELRIQCFGIIERFNAAMLRQDKVAADEAIRAWNDLAYALNGNDNFGVNATPSSPGPRMLRLTAAPIGSVPKWGQVGAFPIVVNGMAAWVDYRGMSWSGVCFAYFDFRVINVSAPFISETGYRSNFVSGHGYYDVVLAEPFTVEACAKLELAALQREAIYMVERGGHSHLPKISRLQVVRDAYMQAIKDAETAPKLKLKKRKYR